MGSTLRFVFLTLFGILTGHTVQSFTSGLYKQGVSSFSDKLSVTPGTPGISVTPGNSVSPGPVYTASSRIPGFSGISSTPVYPFGFYDTVCRNQLTNELGIQISKEIYEFGAEAFKKLAVLSDNHFIFSPYSIWKSLAAVAEGAEESVKQRLYSFLNLPQDRCLRQLYYKLVAGIDSPAVVNLNRQFIFDSNVHLNPSWQRFVTANNLIDIATSPYKTQPENEAGLFRSVFNAQLPNLDLNGNSIILESLDYYVGLWTSAFADPIIESGPFYNSFGEQIGTVEYMKTRIPVNMAYLPEYNLKVIELPVANDGRFKLLLGITVDIPLVRSLVDNLKSSIIFDVLSNLRFSTVSVNIVIPRGIMTTEIEVGSILKAMNFDPIWEDPIATSNISAPSALTSSYTQRVTSTVDSNGIQPFIQRYSNFVPPFHQQNTTTTTSKGGDFIANKPLLFALVNTENYYTVSLAGIFSKPNP